VSANGKLVIVSDNDKPEQVIKYRFAFPTIRQRGSIPTGGFVFD
jgi:hypothetical protein